MPALDVLFNCAGFVHNGTRAAGHRRRMELRASTSTCARSSGPSRPCCPACWPRARGSIINMASVCSSIKGLPNRFIYGTTKAAVIGLTKSVAADYVARWHPLQCDLPRHGGHAFAAGAHQRQCRPGAARKDFIARQPMGRLAQAQRSRRWWCSWPATSRCSSPARPTPSTAASRYEPARFQGPPCGRSPAAPPASGYAIAQRLLASGGSVTLWDRDDDGGAAGRARAGRQGAAVVGGRLRARVGAGRRASHLAQTPRIDALVNSAGITGPNTKVWDYPVEAWRAGDGRQPQRPVLLLPRSRAA